MNNDLISREALKKAIEQGEGFSWDNHGKDDLCVRKKYIDNAPTVDAEEIVRCKDCRHRDPEDFRCDCGRMERVGNILPVHDNYFCAFGDRKEASE